MFKGGKFGFWVILALVLGGLLSSIASSNPDGLEKVADTIGFAAKETTMIKSPMPDYAFPGMEEGVLATGLAGVTGVIVTLVLVIGIGKLSTSSRKKHNPEKASSTHFGRV